ncbi:MAG TPA: ADOP family duplicated permease [Longimicrobiales bacterium]|nr:ADOP family duplicated permease [Longimicrobiales bacterium]
MNVRLALRALARRPAFALLATGALALGIGGTTAVYSLVHTVLVEGLPYEEAHRVVTPDVRSPQGYLISLSIPNYRDWGGRSRSFEAWGGSAGWSFIRPDAEGGAQLLNARLVLGDFFAALRFRPAAGRLFTGAETEPGAAPVAVLGHAFWQRAYGGDPDVVGRTLATDQFTATIVGVLPSGAGYPSPEVEAYIPMGVLGDELPWDSRHSSFGTRAIARLAPGATVEAAQADLARVAAEVRAEVGMPVATPELRRLDDLFLGDVRAGLRVLMGAVGLLLLIACANVASLALARAEGRAGELAVRTALGAGRGRLVRLLLIESAVLAAAGGILGVAIAAAAVRVLPRLLPMDIPALVLGRVALSPAVLAFALAVTVLSGLLFGLVPALRIGAARETTGLRDGARATSGRDARRLRDGLVMTQVALSLVLLVAAGLLTKSLGRLAGVEKGFVAEDVITAARLQAPEGAFDSFERRLAFYEALIAELEAAPDIRSAAATLLVPLTPRSWERGIAPEGAESLDLGDMPSVLYNVVSERYFETLGIPLLRGRGFEPGDREGAGRVVIIDETMAERFWPGEEPVGKRVTFEHHDPDRPREWLTVVGVVANVRHYELETPSRIQAYLPMRQAGPMGLGVAVKTRPGAGAAAAERLRSAVRALQPGIAITELRPLDDVVSDALGPTRALGTLTALFATFALLLAALGIFGALSLAVARRRRELGLRLAVGATPREIVALVARYALVLAGAGAAAGLAGGLGTSRVLGSLLYEVRPFDPAVYALVTLATLGVAAAAAIAPGARAARIDPARVLREE